MAHNTRTRINFAAWANGTAVTQDELDKLDGFAYSAVNGDAGGTWAPAAVIAIGGAGLELASAPLVLSGTASLSVAGATTCTGNFSATGALITLGDTGGDLLVVNAIGAFYGATSFSNTVWLNGNTTIGSTSSNTLVVNSTSTFRNNVTIGENSTDELFVNSTESHTGPESHSGVELHGGSETHGGTAIFDGTTECNGETNFHNNVVIGDSAAHGLTVRANASFTNNVVLGSVLGDTVTVNAATTFATAALRDEYLLITMTADESRNETTPNTLIVTNMTGANRTMTMTSTGSSTGIVKYVANGASSQTLTVVDGSSGRPLGTLSPGQGVRLLMVAGSWYPAG